MLLTMVGIACSQFSLVLLVLTVRPDFSWGADSLCMQGDSPSLHFDFNISLYEQPRCMVQLQMDGKMLLIYDCGSNKVISMNLLKEKGKDMDSCKEDLGTLTDMGNELIPLIPDIKQEKDAEGAPLPLQVRMTCPCKADGSTLEFSLNGQKLLIFYPETKEFRAANFIGERLKKKWEKDEGLKKFFRITLKGDCKKLNQCLVHWKKELERTGASTTATATVPSKATTNMPITWWIYPVILICTTIVGILGC